MKTKVRKRSVKLFIVNNKLELHYPKLLFYLRTLRHPLKKTEIHYPGYWDLIGGAKEPGESDLDAILRESREEIVTNKTPLFDLEYVADVEPIKGEGIDPLAVFRAEIKAQYHEINCTEGRGIVYFEPSEIKELKLPDFFKRFYEKHEDKILNYKGKPNIVLPDSFKPL